MLLAFVDIVSNMIPSPVEAAASKVQLNYMGVNESKLGSEISQCDKDVSLTFIKFYTFFKRLSLILASNSYFFSSLIKILGRLVCSHYQELCYH